MRFVTCHCGRRHFGEHGAAGLLLVDNRGHVLLQLRGDRTHHGGTWALPGGALNPGEDAPAAAVREADEELGIEAAAVRVVGTFPGLDCGTWAYTYVIAVPLGDIELYARTSETVTAGWYPLAAVAALNLHPDLAADWDRLRCELDDHTAARCW